MSGIFVLVPVLSLAPVVLTATSAAATALGFSVAKGHLDDLQQALTDARACDDAVLFELGEARGVSQLLAEQGSIVLDRPDASACFRPGPNGAQMVVTGREGQPREALETLGRTLLDQVTQQYAYHLIVSEVKQRGVDKSQEAVGEDGSIRLQLRRWD